MARQKDVVTISKKAIRRFVIIILLLGLLGGSGFVGYKYLQAKEENKKVMADVERLSNPEESAKEAEDKLLADVAKATVVPDDERPTIADVTDASQLKEQPLFALVENGDKVLLYVKARRQIIFRPSTGQVITAVTLPDEAEEQAETPQGTEETQTEETVESQ